MTKDLTMPEIRQLPAAEPRVETGPIVFGEDWPGTFIRGDNAAHYAFHLGTVLDSLKFSSDAAALSAATLQGLLTDLQSSNLVRR